MSTGDYASTTTSNHAQSAFWPDCLPVSEKRLFIIERSKNANLVIYDANITDGKFDAKKPIEVYWLDYAVSKDPKKTDLIWLEKKMAYGYTSEAVQDKDNEHLITLKALSGKNIRKGRLIIDRNGAPSVLMQINGKDAQLIKIFVCSQETYTVPKVLYVEIYGRDPVTFEDVVEKMTV
eukprot:TRINITY_DN7031_c0_g1_i1.p1 TRINITY_DN7031_c0_g1~~TRINITY_DN7031_c0_g1_i1.p1  ORF type:complete len:178 (-),score=76.28 TRINITY_DN7031_c0_g1_i1:82-615(-)